MFLLAQLLRASHRGHLSPRSAALWAAAEEEGEGQQVALLRTLYGELSVVLESGKQSVVNGVSGESECASMWTRSELSESRICAQREKKRRVKERSLSETELTKIKIQRSGLQTRSSIGSSRRLYQNKKRQEPRGGGGGAQIY